MKSGSRYPVGSQEVQRAAWAYADSYAAFNMRGIDPDSARFKDLYEINFKTYYEQYIGGRTDEARHTLEHELQMLWMKEDKPKQDAKEIELQDKARQYAISMANQQRGLNETSKKVFFLDAYQRYMASTPSVREQLQAASNGPSQAVVTPSLSFSNRPAADSITQAEYIERLQKVMPFVTKEEAAHNYDQALRGKTLPGLIDTLRDLEIDGSSSLQQRLKR